MSPTQNHRSTWAYSKWTSDNRRYARRWLHMLGPAVAPRSGYSVAPPLGWLSRTRLNPGRRRSASVAGPRVEPGAPAPVFAAAALAPRLRGVVPGAGHAIRRPSVYTSPVSHQRAG